MATFSTGDRIVVGIDFGTTFSGLFTLGASPAIKEFANCVFLRVAFTYNQDPETPDQISVLNK